MPRGDKSKYTSKQKRQAEHIEEGYLREGASQEKAERIAWATVNKQDGGGKMPGGSGRNESGMKMTAKQRSEAAKKGWETRKRNSSKR